MGEVWTPACGFFVLTHYASWPTCMIYIMNEKNQYFKHNSKLQGI